ncbi:MAG: hypothetical protein AAFZ65_16195, partial [Planctomycetota bacterium]
HYLVEAYHACLREQPDLAAATLMALASVPLETVELSDPGGLPEPPGTSRMALLRFFLGELDQGRRLDPVLQEHLLLALGLAFDSLPEPARTQARETVADPVLSLYATRDRLRRPVVDALVRVLGCLGRAADGKLDATLREALWAATDEPELGTRTTAYLALVEGLTRPASDDSGDDAELLRARSDLARRLTRGRSTDRPAVALALGVGARDLRAAGTAVPAIWTVSLRTSLKTATSPEERSAIAIALGLVQDSESVEPLLEIFESLPNGGDRARAALGIGMLGAPSTLAELRTAFQKLESEPGNAARVAEALAHGGDTGLRARVTAIAGSGYDQQARAAALAACSRIGTPSGVPPILALASDPDAPAQLQAAALFAVGRMLAADALDWAEVLAPLDSTSEVRIWPGSEYGWDPLSRL